MRDSFHLAWRYPDEYADMLTEELATLNSVPAEQILLGDGSGEILKLSAAAFTGNDKKIVIGNPTFEAIARHAGVANAEVVKIDLTSDYRHDLNKMLAPANGERSCLHLQSEQSNRQHHSEQRNLQLSHEGFAHNDRSG